MRTLRLSLAAAVVVLLAGGLSSAVVAQDDAEATAFPTGSLVSVENNYLLLVWNEDGTGEAHDVFEGYFVPIIYATHGDLYTEMKHEAAGERQVPATYYWDFDGEHLTMELWGEDPLAHRNTMYADQTWTPIEDPQAIMVAAIDIGEGASIAEWQMQQGFVPAAEVGPDTLTVTSEVVGAVAAVPIAKGQPVTPDMLVPPAE